jgi:hypothetical protein
MWFTSGYFACYSWEMQLSCGRSGKECGGKAEEVNVTIASVTNDERARWITNEWCAGTDVTLYQEATISHESCRRHHHQVTLSESGRLLTC